MAKFFCNYSILLVAFFFFTCENKKNAKNDKIEQPALEATKITKQNTVTAPIQTERENAKKEIKSKDCHFDTSMANQGLVNIAEIDSSILVELKYSSTDNFVGKDVYGCLSACYLQSKAANMLAQASAFLQNENDSLRLLIYDGGRPHQIQIILWNSLPQYSPNIRKNYVANPVEGSIHNYGSAVDLTIAYADGKPLDMGTKYDFFGELAYPKYENIMLANGKLNELQINNRKLLRKVMQKAGFTPIEYEWWHFNAVSRAKAKALYKMIE